MKRREFLGAVTGAVVLGHSSLMRADSVRDDGHGAQLAKADTPGSYIFPKDFFWGSATASYQVEGAWNAGGKEESVWDRFCHTPGRVKGGDTGDIACDQFHRYPEDIDIMRRLHLRSYRFSISWPRVQFSSTGKPNQAGLDHYDRFTDALLAAGIRPLCTLYHWDLPQLLQDRGGWLNRDLASYFADYAGIVSRQLGDRIAQWAVFNEPWIFTYLGYASGSHPPGARNYEHYLRAAHTVNLAQAMATRTIRAQSSSAKIGSAYNMAPAVPVSASFADADAAKRYHQFNNLYFLEASMHGRYPALLSTDRALTAMGFRAGDERLMEAPLDWIGINYYKRTMVQDQSVSGDSLSSRVTASIGTEGWLTHCGWEVWPQGLYDIVMRISREYPGIPIEITENGCAYSDSPEVGSAARIRDDRRILYYREHLIALASAIRDGADVRGYHAWSLLDNLEWQEGYGQRFGLVYVDFPTQARVVKDSGNWYGRVAAANKVDSVGESISA
jgi:beta-glucosidase